MSLSLVLGLFWVFAATVVALLPMRMQYPPGIMLLIAAPVLIVLIGREHGAWVGVLALAAFLSMFRRPLSYLARKAMGLQVRRPKEEGAQG
ncbi:MAG: DUF2484 family protein [Rhodobacteraceae bacterium]|nr:DUF2484 family protein [Paracoccaceae bacterium]